MKSLSAKLLSIVAAGVVLSPTLGSCSIIQGTKYFNNNKSTPVTLPAEPATAKPVVTSKPVEKPAKTKTAQKPAQPAKPAQPVQAVNSTQSAKPIEKKVDKTEPVKATKPAESKPVVPVMPAEAAKPVVVADEQPKPVVKKDKPTKVEVANPEATKDKQEKKSKKDKSKDKKKDKVKEAVTVATGTLVDVSEIANAIAGEWAIIAAGTTQISGDEDLPYINFNQTEGRFYGSNGCNVLNGSYAVNGQSISFSNVLATMKYCPGVEFEQKINAVVCDNNTVSASIIRHKDCTVLEFTDSQGRKLLTLKRHNLDFINGFWFVKSVYGKSIKDEEANLFIDVNERKIHGNTGCNFFNGNIYIDDANPSIISFNGMAVTRMACNKGDQERNMLLALEDTAAAKQHGQNTVVLIDHHGREVVTLQRGDVPGMDADE